MYVSVHLRTPTCSSVYTYSFPYHTCLFKDSISLHISVCLRTLNIADSSYICQMSIQGPLSTHGWTLHKCQCLFKDPTYTANTSQIFVCIKVFIYRPFIRVWQCLFKDTHTRTHTHTHTHTHTPYV